MDDAGSAIPRRLPRKSAALAAVLGWILPGLGQMYVGRPGRGFYFLVVVLATYAAGLLLGDFRCVNVDREPIWFAAQSLLAGPTAAIAWLTQDLEIARRIPTYDAGILYCAVAALLNAVVVADALGTVDDLDRDATEREEEERAARAAESAARAVEEAARARAAESSPSGEALVPSDAEPAAPSSDGAPAGDSPPPLPSARDGAPLDSLSPRTGEPEPLP